MSKRIEGLFRQRMELESLILRATTNGEKANRIEILESKLARIEAKIDKENIRLYGAK